MKNRNAKFHWGFLGLGVLIGGAIFFLSYWWIGALTLAATIGIISGGVIIIAKRFQRQESKEKEK